MTEKNIFEVFIKNKFDKKENIEMSCYHGIYPTHHQINLIIKFLNNFKKENSNEEIIKHNNKREYEIFNPIKTIKKPIPQSGYIYIIKSNNIYKIGRAKNTKYRFNAYRAENPFEIEVVFKKQVDDYIKKETELLRIFKEKNIRGEWFSLSSSDIDFIKNDFFK